MIIIPICFLVLAVIAAGFADHAEKRGRYFWLIFFGLAALFLGLCSVWSGFVWVMELDRSAYVN